jgi:hypothetical protein
MPTSRSFHENMIDRAKSDPDFRRSLLRESTDAILNGEFDVGYRLIRDYMMSVSYLGQVGADLGVEEEEVVGLFDPDSNVAGTQLVAVLLLMLQHEGMALATRRQVGVVRRPLS